MKIVVLLLLLTIPLLTQEQTFPSVFVNIPAKAHAKTSHLLTEPNSLAVVRTLLQHTLESAPGWRFLAVIGGVTPRRAHRTQTMAKRASTGGLGDGAPFSAGEPVGSCNITAST